MARVFYALILIIVVAALRWPTLDQRIWNLDEGSTFTMAQVVRDGGVIYRDAADNRTPLVPYVKALIFGVVGDWNLRGAHLALSLLLGLIAIGLWRISAAAGAAPAGMVAAGCFTLLHLVMMPEHEGLAAHTEWFLIFFSAFGMWMFVHAFKRGRVTLALIAGVSFGFAALAKQPGVIDWGVCVTLLALASWSEPQHRTLHLRLFLALLSGLIAVLATGWAYLAWTGAWDEFLRYCWQYNLRIYVPEVPLAERLQSIRTPFQLAWHQAPFVLLLGLTAAGWLLRQTLPTLWNRQRPFPLLPWLILGWTASGLVATTLTGRHFAHYSIQVLPGLCLACGWAAVRLWALAGTWRSLPNRITRLFLAVGFLSLAVAAIHRVTSLEPGDRNHEKTGEIIRTHLPPEERILVWGYLPELHAYAQRLPNTRFIFSVYLTGMVPWTNLDPSIDTSYAVVNGAWDDFWQDFERTPAAMIIDTQSIRGFLKYRLRKQERLWREIEQHYVEIEHEHTSPIGLTLYRRAAASPPPLWPGDTPVDERIAVSGPSRSSRNQTLRIRVGAPIGTRIIDLYLNDQPYRRLEHAPEREVQAYFLIPPADLPETAIRIQAIAHGESSAASSPLEIAMQPEPEKPAGPLLNLAGKWIAPEESTTITEEPARHLENEGVWIAHAPARLVYRRPPELARLDFSFGISAASYAGTATGRTDGVEVIVHSVNELGQQTELYRRALSPDTNPDDRGLQHASITLPEPSLGELVLQFTPGRFGDPTYDWSYWGNLDGHLSPLALMHNGVTVMPSHFNAPLGLALMSHAGRDVLLAHAPAEFTYTLPDGLAGLSGEFGVLNSAWQGAEKTTGVVFEVEQVDAKGAKSILFTRTLYPATTESDRQIQSFQIQIPRANGNRLILRARAAHHGNVAFAHTYWHGLTATHAPPSGE